MKKIWNIYTTDINNIRKNWVVAVIIIGLIILPSLYAWINIKASWDPYSQTDQIPVGVVNEDKGAEVRDEFIHVGDELITTLTENDSFDWHFIDEAEAMDKIDYGDFYAVLVIPSDFSQNLGTVIESEPEKASVEYYVNEKINAIAPKITEKGASVIVEQISSNFISTVNGVIFEIFNEIGIEIEEELPDIRQVEEYIFTLEEKLPDVYETMTDSLTDAEVAITTVQKAQAQFPRVKQLTSNGLKKINHLQSVLEEAEEYILEVAPTIGEEVERMTETINDVNGFIEELQDSDVGSDFATKIKKVEETIEQTLEATSTITEALEQYLEAMKDTDENEEITIIIEDLKALEDELTTINDSIQSLETFFQEHESDIKDYAEDIEHKAQNMIKSSEQLVDYYEDTIEPTVLKQMKEIQDILKNAQEMVTSIDQSIPEMEQMLISAETSLIDGKDLLERGIDEYPVMNDKITNLADRIREVKEGTDIHEIIELLKNDPEAEKNFFAEPVLLNENRIYPIENYGTGMTPFYTVLAMWVGVVLLISLLSVDVKDRKDYTVRHIYFGRLLTFLTIAILQTLIVTLGDVTFIGVQASSSVWFILFSLVISLTFTTVIYTVVSVFGDVGKAIAIIMLVLQIASSGGTYPVVLLPEFFQFINPLLPFTYAVDLMREAVGGIIWMRAIKNILILLGMSLLFISFAMFAKEPFNKRSEKLMKKSKEASLFQ